MPVLIVALLPMLLSLMVPVLRVLPNTALLAIMQMFVLLVKVAICSSMLHVLPIARQDTFRMELIALQLLPLLSLSQPQDSLFLFRLQELFFSSLV